MWRALLFLAVVAFAAYWAVWIVEHPGTVTIVWSGYQVGVSLAVALLAILIVMLAVLIVIALGRGLFGFPSFVGRTMRERRRHKGMSALSRGLIAVGADDAMAAKTHAKDAENLLGRQPLTLLLKAQAAQMSGDHEVAERAFRSMTDDPETRVLGLRGLYDAARLRHDTMAARGCAAEAARLAPSVTWANDAVLGAYCADGEWSSAVATVERRASLGLVDKRTARRQRAVLLTAAAQSHEAGEPDTAEEQALRAVKLAPDLVPAACIAGRVLARKAKLHKAAKIVETAWKAGPHPDLARVYLSLRPGDSTRDRLARAETLARLSSWDPESRLAMGQTACEGRDFAKAREVLAPLVVDHPTVRTCLLMARIEEGEHGAGSGRARQWLARAAHAPRDPAWIADGVVSDHWEPMSPVTGRLDAFEWKTPPEVLAGPGDADADFAPTPEPTAEPAKGPTERPTNGPGTIAISALPPPRLQAHELDEMPAKAGNSGPAAPLDGAKAMEAEPAGGSAYLLDADRPPVLPVFGPGASPDAPHFHAPDESGIASSAPRSLIRP